MKIRYDSDVMKYISLFESITKAKVKDCISNERIIFIVHENEIGKAIGKSGINVRKIENMLKKKIKIVEFSSDVVLFVGNMIYPLQTKSIENDDGIVRIAGHDTKTKALLIGRESKNLDNLKKIVRRYFDIRDIVVL